MLNSLYGGHAVAQYIPKLSCYERVLHSCMKGETGDNGIRFDYYAGISTEKSGINEVLSEKWQVDFLVVLEYKLINEF